MLFKRRTGSEKMRIAFTRTEVKRKSFPSEYWGHGPDQHMNRACRWPSLSAASKIMNESAPLCTKRLLSKAKSLAKVRA
jgi:hypothetical protein